MERQPGIDITLPAWLSSPVLRIQYFIAIGVVSTFVLLAAGCSKGSGKPAPATPPNVTDLGAVELVAESPKQFGIGANRSCIVTGKQLTNGIEVMLVVQTTNTDGTVDSSQAEMVTLPGRQCAISVGDTMIGLTPTLKPQ